MNSMDISSIITQVTDPASVTVPSQVSKRPDEEHMSEESSLVQSGDGPKEILGPNPIHHVEDSAAAAPAPAPAPAAVAVDLEQVKSPVDGRRRRKSGGAVSRLLCCFGVGARRGGERGGGGGGASEHYRNGQTRLPELLGPRDPAMADRICAVIDLDETLVHSSFKYVQDPDFVIGVEIEGLVHQVYVLKRPFADEFLRRMGELFECVLFTASLAKYADPVSDHLDKWGAFKYRLFREACVFHCDNYVKDLSLLGRPVDRCLIIDNSPASYMLNKENAIQVKTWLGEKSDTELRDLLPYMEELARAQSVPAHLHDHPPPSQVLNFGHILHLHDR